MTSGTVRGRKLSLIRSSITRKVVMALTSNASDQASAGAPTLEQESEQASAPTLQQGIDQAGSPVHLLWQPNAPQWRGPVLPDEYVGWREEQDASNTSVALSDLSFHMRDLFIEGPDATRLLSACSANDYENFAVDRAKQFVVVNEDGYFVADGILLRTGEDKYTLSGIPPAMSWVLFHAEQGDYDVSFIDDPDSAMRPADQPPVLYRYQVQGPRALDLVARVFGGPLPETKFFHSTIVTLDGRSVRALRHGMAGQPGYEFMGPWADGEYVEQALLSAGEEFDLVRVGSLAYSTLSIPTGWMPTPTPAIYSAPELKPYREWLPLHSLEGHYGLHGTFFSENIEDYYVSPYELGYGKSISLKRDYPGRDALAKAKNETTRTKVTLVLNPDDVREMFDGDPGFYMQYANHRIELDGGLIGIAYLGSHIASVGTILFVSLVDISHAAPGTEVTVVLGEDPGFATDDHPTPAFSRIRATVQPAPYDEYARDHYRRN